MQRIKDVKAAPEWLAAASGWYSSFGGNSTELETGSAVETVRHIATHQAVHEVQLQFVAPGKTRQIPLGQVRSFPPNFSQAACGLQQTTWQTQCISRRACFPAKNGLGDQSLGGVPNSATADWAASCLEYIRVKKQFVLRRENKTKTRKNLKKLFQNNY